MSRLYAKRGILHDDRFLGLDSRFLQAHKIRLGVWLAVLNIKACYHQFLAEEAGVMMLQTFK